VLPLFSLSSEPPLSPTYGSRDGTHSHSPSPIEEAGASDTAPAVGSYGTTWSLPSLHNGSLRSSRVGQRKVKKTPCNSLFKHGLVRPTLTSRKYVLTCANRTDLVIHDPHRPNEIAHLIRVRSMVQVHLGPRQKILSAALLERESPQADCYACARTTTLIRRIPRSPLRYRPRSYGFV
jgi:hypothetical protein